MMNRTVRVVRGVVAALLLVGVAGCQFKLMPTPVVVDGGNVNPFLATPPAARDAVLPVLFATDRAPIRRGDPDAGYASRPGEHLRLGFAEVTFGRRDAPWQKLVDGSLNEHAPRPTIRISNIEEFGHAWPSPARPAASPDDPPPAIRAEHLPAVNAYLRHIRKHLDQSRQQDIFIFVHGFNTSFDFAIRLASQFWHYLGRDGVFIAYSWPSHNHPLNYHLDARRGQMTVSSLHRLIRLLADETPAERIHLLSFSAGAPVISNTLERMHASAASLPPSQRKERYRIGQVLYAGPDEDLERLQALHDAGAFDLADGVTIYSSQGDWGIGLAQTLIAGGPRAGGVGVWKSEQGRALLGANGDLHVVNVTGAQRAEGWGGWLGHSYWYSNPWVNSDVLLLMKESLPPDRRGLLRDGQTLIYRFPQDYANRVRAAAREIALQNARSVRRDGREIAP